MKTTAFGNKVHTFIIERSILANTIATIKILPNYGGMPDPHIFMYKDRLKEQM